MDEFGTIELCYSSDAFNKIASNSAIAVICFNNSNRSFWISEELFNILIEKPSIINLMNKASSIEELVILASLNSVSLMFLLHILKLMFRDAKIELNKYYNSKWQKRNENEERKSRMMPKPNLKAIEDCVEFIRISGGIIKKLDALLKG